jgi:excisionase family DNA binding protein
MSKRLEELKAMREAQNRVGKVAEANPNSTSVGGGASTPPKFYTVAEVAGTLRVHVKTIRRRIARRDIRATKPPGAQAWLIPESEFKRVINDGVNG